VLLAEKELRLKYYAISSSVVEWLNTAESVIQEDYAGIDYEVVDQQLTLHKVCFTLLSYKFFGSILQFSAFIAEYRAVCFTMFSISVTARQCIVEITSLLRQQALILLRLLNGFSTLYMFCHCLIIHYDCY